MNFMQAAGIKTGTNMPCILPTVLTFGRQDERAKLTSCAPRGSVAGDVNILCQHVLTLKPRACANTISVCAVRLFCNHAFEAELAGFRKKCFPITYHMRGKPDQFIGAQ